MMAYRTFSRLVRHGAFLSCLTVLPLAANAANATNATNATDAANPVDLGQQVPETKAINEGLFPEDACKELEQAGYKCMGFKPAVRFSLPTATFKIGSAELPDLLRQQLDRFAEVLRGKRGSGRVVVIEGHADASGSDDVNLPLSQKRAEAVKDYLVKNGADQSMLMAKGMGSRAPKITQDPTAAENRRVEIGRQSAP